MRFCLILANRFEEIEAVTLIDLLRRAGLIIDIYGVGSKLIHGGQKIGIEADSIFNKESDVNTQNYHGLILPGGPGTGDLSKNHEVLKLVQNFQNQNKLIFAICAAPLILEKAGVLVNKKYTCYPGVEQEIQKGSKQNMPFVKDCNIITSEGIGSAIESALFLVETILSKEDAQELAKKIVYHSYL